MTVKTLPHCSTLVLKHLLLFSGSPCSRRYNAAAHYSASFVSDVLHSLLSLLMSLRLLLVTRASVSETCYCLTVVFFFREDGEVPSVARLRH